MERIGLNAPGRIILGLMVFTMAFSLVGGEIQKNGGGKQTVSPFMILFGGTVATSALTLLSHAGEPGVAGGAIGSVVSGSTSVT